MTPGPPQDEGKWPQGLADDTGAIDDRRERPQPGPADGPGQARELQQGPPTLRGRPNKGPADDYPPSKLQKLPHPGLAEGLEQLARLQQRPLPPRGQPHQGGLAEVCLVSALEAALEKAPQTRKFLEEELPRVSISCQAGFEPGGVHNDAPERPHLRPAEGPKQPTELHQRPSSPRARPQQVGLAEVLPGRVQNLLGP